MDKSKTLASVLLGVAQQPFLLVLLIIVATFILEDIATITVALLASQMVLDPTVAILALVSGTVLGDLAVYAIARKASHTAFVARILASCVFQNALCWLHRHAVPSLLLARFTPGLRLPIFAAAGSSGIPLRLFATVIGLSTLVWTPGLFYVAGAAGTFGLKQVGGYGWLLPAALVVFFMLVSRIVPAIIGRSHRLAVTAV